MKVKFVGGRAREVIPATGAAPFMAKPACVYDVDDETGRSLLDQPVWFEPVAEPKPPAEPKKKPGEKPPAT